MDHISSPLAPLIYRAIALLFWCAGLSIFSLTRFHSPHLRRKASWKGCKLLERPTVSPDSESRHPENKVEGDSGGDDDNLKR